MRYLMIGFLLCSTWALAQQSPQSDQPPPENQQPPRSEQPEESRDRSKDAGQSSSRDTRIDIRPPKDDAKEHPNTGAGLSDPDAPAPSASDVQELHAFNPYRAAKDNEVGDYYFKRKNYKAALARFQDTLQYKENDAFANYRLAQCYEKLGQPDEAVPRYQEYLRILPQGPFSKEVRKALAKLGAPEKPATVSVETKQ
jgi:tetratricopeptide (TPR) repeat protein